MKPSAIVFFLAFAALAAHAQDRSGRVEDANPDNPLLAPEDAPPPTVDDGEAHGLPHPVVAADAPPDFNAADADGDGVLSTQEVRQALPDLVVVDINSDGLVNHAEAENALPGLTLHEEGERSSTDAGVGRVQYALIVQHLAEQEVLQETLRGERPDDALPPTNERSTADLDR